jgi:hypothetical protein
MADLAGALDAALRARYRVAEVKTPITQRRGLLARMNQLEKLHTRKGDRPGSAGRRAAAAAGIPPDQWTRWKKGQRTPSAASLRKLEGAYSRQVTQPAFRRAIKTRGVPAKVTVTATVKWSTSDRKQYNAIRHRTVRLFQMRPVMGPTIRAWVAAGPQAAADAFQRGVSAQHSEPDEEDGRPGIEFEGDHVQIEFP